MKFLTFTVVFLFSYQSFSFSDYSKVKTPDKPGIDNNKQYDFKKEPVKFLEAAYMDHHFWTIDRGIKRVDQALSILDPIFKKNPNTKFMPKMFRHSKVYEIKSTVHVLKGLLLYRKSQEVIAKSQSQISEKFAKKMNVDKNAKVDMKKMAHKKLNAKEMKVYSELRSKDFSDNKQIMKKYVVGSIDQMKMAIDVDKSNPVAYYQYGKLLIDYLIDGDTQLAEKQFFKAGELSWNEKDTTGYHKAMTAIRELNAKSTYISK